MCNNLHNDKIVELYLNLKNLPKITYLNIFNKIFRIYLFMNKHIYK